LACTVCIFEILRYFIGIDILPVLFIATLFLGIYLNLSVWYKLTDRTVYGAYISVAGAAVTIVINVVFIPQFGYWASTWATLAAYFVMMMISLIWGQARFPIPYHFYRNTVIILITIVVALAYYQNLKQYILLGNIIFLVLAAVFIINQKLIPARMLNKKKNEHKNHQ